MSSEEALVRMANQIARNLARTGDPAAATAAHIRTFWEPRMKARLLAHLDAGGDGLSDTAREAARTLRG